MIVHQNHDIDLQTMLQMLDNFQTLNAISNQKQRSTQKLLALSKSKSIMVWSSILNFKLFYQYSIDYVINTQ